MTQKLWSEDWSTFVSHIQDWTRQGKSKEEINQTLSGRTVRWRGQLERKVLTGAAPGVTILMPSKDVEIDRQLIANVQVLSLPVAEEDIEPWNRTPIGEEVLFSARFLSLDALFPAFDVRILSSERVLLSLSFDRGWIE